MSSATFPKQQLWAQYYTVGPEGFVDCDGEPAMRPTTQEASRIARLPNQVIDIAWIDFTFCVGEPGSADEETYPVGPGESFIATSRRSIQEVRFKPVSAVLERGQLTQYTAEWLGRLVAGNHSATPSQYKNLIALLRGPRG